jgi:hypothetical protein
MRQARAADEAAAKAAAGCMPGGAAKAAIPGSPAGKRRLRQRVNERSCQSPNARHGHDCGAREGGRIGEGLGGRAGLFPTRERPGGTPGPVQRRPCVTASARRQGSQGDARSFWLRTACPNRSRADPPKPACRGGRGKGARQWGLVETPAPIFVCGLRQAGARAGCEALSFVFSFSGLVEKEGSPPTSSGRAVVGE